MITGLIIGGCAGILVGFIAGIALMGHSFRRFKSNER